MMVEEYFTLDEWSSLKDLIYMMIQDMMEMGKSNFI